MSTRHPDPDSEVVAGRLAIAAERLRARPEPEPAPVAPATGSLTAAEALVLLREACDGLAATEREVRHARSEIASLAARAAARRPPLDAA
ncbi:MAG: hypothetical protein M3Z33_02670 [Actinomycetota bacterium]|nr:hypothetical protein [Actinomycetota bacterium]